MKRLIQMIPTHHRHDAAGSEVLVIERLMREYGWHVQTYADHIDPELRDSTSQSSELDNIDEEGAVALYHFCVSSSMTQRFIDLDCTKLIFFHNITPGEFYRPYDEHIAEACDEGRRQLVLLSDHVDMAVAHSEYSRRELESEGFDVTRTIPFLFDTSKIELKPDKEFVKQFTGDPIVLFTGRQAPNKAPDDFIRVAAAYNRLQMPKARFVLVGKRDVLPAYARELDDLVKELNVTKDLLTFTDEIPQEALNACYRSAAIFLSLSKHEGFMVPLLESMHFGLPVLARSLTAVPETLGDAGILFDSDDHDYIAELVAALISDDNLRKELIERGHKRAKRFSLERWGFVLKVLLEEL